MEEIKKSRRRRRRSGRRIDDEAMSWGRSGGGGVVVSGLGRTSTKGFHVGRAVMTITFVVFSGGSV